MRYYFHIKGDRSFTDVDGLEMPGIEAVQAEAVGVARDMMRLQPLRSDWSGCSIYVTDEGQAAVLEVAFIDAGRAAPK